MDVDYTITLLKPVTFAGEKVTTLGFREPTGGDIERMQSMAGNDLVKSFALMADLAQVDPGLFRVLSVRDIGQINGWLEPIMDPKGPPGA